MLTFRTLKAIEIFLVIVVFKQQWLEVAASSYLEDNYPASVIEDANLDMEGLTAKYKYPLEVHFATTEDKYIVRMHRLARPKARPVFLMHGLLDSSITWISPGPWAGLGYYLYDEGYDVWMGNARGNYYSRNHTFLDPDTDKKYWSFSWHEIGYYDLPAMIDYILDRTGYSKLAYFGHSQGTTSCFVFLSMRPAYNEKISIMSALAPVAFTARIKVPIPLLGLVTNAISYGARSLTEVLPRNKLAYIACFSSKVMEETCNEYLYQIMGRHPKMWNATMAPAILAHLPSGCNIKQVIHYGQLINSNRFCQFDYDPQENLRRYKSIQPSDYPLEKITAPVALYYTYNDHLSSELDVMRLAKLLPNVVEDHLYAQKTWNHMTIVWGVNIRELAHKHILKVMRKYE